MSRELVARLGAAEPIRALEAAALPDRGWIVGGAVRDAALGNEITDVDLAVEGDPKPWATAVARKLRGSPFRLSSEFGTWRVVARDRSWTADFSSLRGETIERDLALRDFTINACALEVGGSGEVVDPFGGLTDLEAGRLVAVSDDVFEHDPLRLMRAARQASELGLAIDPATAELARRSARLAAQPAAERVYMELRAVLGGADPVRGIGLMAELGIEPVLLPELHALRGVTQGRYHHLEAYEHTLEVVAQVLEVEAGGADDRLGPAATEARQLLGGELGDGISRTVGLRLAALLHDVGKAGTRTVMPGGKVGFPGHDAAGAGIVRAVMSRLRASRVVSGYVAALTAGHLRLGFMVHRQPIDERQIHAYLRGAHPWAVDLTLLTVADRLATRGRKADEAIEAHLGLASRLLERAVAWEVDGPPELPIGGAELAGELGIRPGPKLGRLLAELEADAYAGELQDREAVVERARELIR